LFANDQPDPSGFGEGRTFVGSTVVMTDADGRAAFAIDLPAAIAPGQFLTATATDAFGNTSEFSQARLVADAARADLAASLAPPPIVARVGDELSVTATVTNRGPARATGAVMGVTLPPGLDFVAAQPSR